MFNVHKNNKRDDLMRLMIMLQFAAILQTFYPAVTKTQSQHISKKELCTNTKKDPIKSVTKRLDKMEFKPFLNK